MTNTQFIEIDDEGTIDAATADRPGQYEVSIRDSEPFGDSLIIKGSREALLRLANAIRAIVPDAEEAELTKAA
jgi:hypothetical protein